MRLFSRPVTGSAMTVRVEGKDFQFVSDNKIERFSGSIIKKFNKLTAYTVNPILPVKIDSDTSIFETCRTSKAKEPIMYLSRNNAIPLTLRYDLRSSVLPYAEMPQGIDTQVVDRVNVNRGTYYQNYFPLWPSDLRPYWVQVSVWGNVVLNGAPWGCELIVTVGKTAGWIGVMAWKSWLTLSCPEILLIDMSYVTEDIYNGAAYVEVYMQNPINVTFNIDIILQNAPIVVAIESFLT